jgi:L-asparagine transporter-like permease
MLSYSRRQTGNRVRQARALAHAQAYLNEGADFAVRATVTFVQIIAIGAEVTAVAGMIFVWTVILSAHLAFRRTLGKKRVALLPIRLPFSPRPTEERLTTPREGPQSD